MSSPTITNRQLLELIKVYWQWRALWIMSTFLFGTLGLMYVLFLKSDVWVAMQGLMVRDEANGAVMRLGRFQSQTEMKTAQETIQEMARSTQVLHAALSQVGRDETVISSLQTTAWPSTKDIEELAKNGIEVRAPRGAELGTTEVIYLDIKQRTPKRAFELNKAVCAALEEHLQSVRRSRADGVIAELQTAKVASESSLAEATERLRQMEAEAGTDLADLRGLTDTSGGGNTNRQVLDSIKSEIRQVELKLGQLNVDLQLARESMANPDAFLLTPGRLVTEQPGLKKLREGLADASIKISELKGRFTEQNVLVKAAIETEARIREQLRQELNFAVETLSNDAEVTTQLLTKLRSQQEQLESRLTKIAGMRADYANTVSDVRARATHLQELQRELAEAEAARDAAVTSSLLTRLGVPILGERPLGPGKSTIVGGAACCGLFFGLGVVFLLTPLDGQINYGRRRQDLAGRGRRREDTQTAANAPPASVVENDSDDKVVAAQTIPDTVEIASARIRACDILVPRATASVRVSVQGNVKPATSTPASSGGSVVKASPSSWVDVKGVKLSELSNQPPRSAAASSPSSELMTGSSQGTATKPRPTPWTSSSELKAAAQDGKFADNALLGRMSTPRKTAVAPVIELVPKPSRVESHPSPTAVPTIVPSLDGIPTSASVSVGAH